MGSPILAMLSSSKASEGGKTGNTDRHIRWLGFLIVVRLTVRTGMA